MHTHPSRREILSSSIPAAIAGASLTGIALGQQQPAPSAGGAPGHGPDIAAGGQGVPAGGSLVQRMLATAYQNNEYHLPHLPYPYDALEPNIDAMTMQLHHDKHHQAYVDGLNKAIRALADLQAGGDIEATRLSGIERNLSFNAGGHLLHTVFWATMGAGQVSQPQGDIIDAIRKQFGAFDFFRKYFSKVALGIKGSGWAVLTYEPIGDRLLVVAVNEHDTHLIPGAYPLLPLDVWEHAYYLKYTHNRAQYVDAWWNVVNWPVVDESYRWIRSRSREAEITTSGR